MVRQIALTRLFDASPDRPDAISAHYDHLGGVSIIVFLMLAPEDATDEEIRHALARAFPAQHCTHAHDCCGQYYAKEAQLLGTDHFMDDDGRKYRLAIVKRKSYQNV